MNDWSFSTESPSLDRVKIGDREVKPGDAVRLWPLGRADILDMALEGQIAKIESIEQDLEDRIYLAVTIDCDPGNDLGRLKQPGHRFFFGVEEVEPLTESSEMNG